jgi:hypothetical protein
MRAIIISRAAIGFVPKNRSIRVYFDEPIIIISFVRSGFMPGYA